MDIYEAISALKEWLEKTFSAYAWCNEFSDDYKKHYDAVQTVVERCEELQFEKDTEGYDEWWQIG